MSHLNDNSTLMAVCIALGIAGFYLFVRFYGGRRSFSWIDALVVAVLMSVGAAVLPIQQASAERAKQKAVLANLYSIRSQLALYKLQHAGDVPIFYQGSLPQLIQETDAKGYTGVLADGRKFGPYFSESMPPNAMTGKSMVTPIFEFPPKSASGNGGWLYQQSTGQIAIDSPEFLNQ